MSRRWTLIAATPAGSAGKPQAQNELLCGMFTPAADSVSGSSNIDHPDGASSTGKTYKYTGQTCENNSASSDGTYTWTITHSNVHTGGGQNDEHGTEHVQFAMTENSGHAAGAQGHVTNFDL